MRLRTARPASERVERLRLTEPAGNQGNRLACAVHVCAAHTVIMGTDRDRLEAYLPLARMVESGLIEAVRSTDPADERRNNYRITPLGLRIAKSEAQRLHALTRAARMSGLLQKKAT